MNDRWIKPIAVAALFAAFGVISFLVVVTRRHPFFVHRKLRLGALLFSMTGVTLGCRTTTCYEPAITCYETAVQNRIVVDQADQSNTAIVLDVAESDSLSGYIDAQQIRQAYSFALLDSSDSVMTQGGLRPLDGAFNEGYETFSLRLLDVPPAGLYDLRFYDAAMDLVRDLASYVARYSLQIVDNR